MMVVSGHWGEGAAPLFEVLHDIWRLHGSEIREGWILLLIQKPCDCGIVTWSF